MAITYGQDIAVFDETVSVDDAEQLLEWIQKHPGGSVDLVGCTHLHAANLQVLMASRVSIAALPTAMASGLPP